jgi:hypothetical protein
MTLALREVRFCLIALEAECDGVLAVCLINLHDLQSVNQPFFQDIKHRFLHVDFLSALVTSGAGFYYHSIGGSGCPCPATAGHGRGQADSHQVSRQGTKVNSSWTGVSGSPSKALRYLVQIFGRAVRAGIGINVQAAVAALVHGAGPAVPAYQHERQFLVLFHSTRLPLVRNIVQIVRRDRIAEGDAVGAGHGGVQAHRLDSPTLLPALVADRAGHGPPCYRAERIPVQLRAVQPVLDREQVAEDHNVVPIVSETVMSQEPRDGPDVLSGQLLAFRREGPELGRGVARAMLYSLQAQVWIP